MAYTTLELINSAYNVAGVVSKDFQTVDTSQANNALEWLNSALSFTDLDFGLVPYETTYSFNFVAGQEKYTIANLIEIDTITFVKNSVRYSLTYTKRNAYFGSNRVNTITTLPYEWYFERQLGGGDLYLYFFPDQAYAVEIHGVFRLDEVTLYQDLSLTLDRFYRDYLKLELANWICIEYNYALTEGAAKQLDKYRNALDKRNRKLDLRMKKKSTLNNRPGAINWAFVNLGGGFIPPY